MQNSDDEFVAARNGLYQTEPMRLQQEANNYTRQVEHERKRLNILTDNYKQAQEKLQEIKDEIDRKIGEAQAIQEEEPEQANQAGDPWVNRLYPNPKKVKTEHQEKAHLRSLKHKLEHEKVRLNNITGENKDLKVKIDSMRFEIGFANICIKKMESAILLLKEDSRNSNKEGFLYARQASETNNQILALKCKHEEGKEAFETDIKMLQEQLKEKDQKVEFNDKSLSRTMEAKKGQGSKQDFANPIVILQIRLDSVVKKNQEKKRLLDQYVRNAKIIQEAFETIMEATGINNIDEIVTAFIKAEEQNVQLFNYVDQLNQENDQLEESNRNYDAQIEMYEQMAAMNSDELNSKIGTMDEQNNELRERIVSANTEINTQEQEFQELQLLCQDLQLDFKDANFNARVATSMSYDEHTVFTESNITTYLAELEEYIASLIAYTAHKNGDPNAAVSSVPLNALNSKDFKQAEMAIDPAYDITVHTVDAEEEEDTTDVNVLYQRFQNKIDQNLIQGNRKADNKAAQQIHD